MTKNEASSRIAAILKAYEESSGEVVRGIELHAIEVRGLADPGPMVRMTVHIETERMPGRGWSV